MLITFYCISLLQWNWSQNIPWLMPTTYIPNMPEYAELPVRHFDLCWKPTFSNSSSTVGPIFTKIESDDLQTVLTKCYGFCIDRQNRFRIPQRRISSMMPKWHFSLYLCNALAYWHQTLCVPLSSHTEHTKMIWLQRHLLVKSDKPFNHNTSACIYDFSTISITIILKLL